MLRNLTVYIEVSLRNPSESGRDGSLKITTCSSSVLELSSGMVSGKTVSFGEDTQLPSSSVALVMVAVTVTMVGVVWSE